MFSGPGLGGEGLELGAAGEADTTFIVSDTGRVLDTNGIKIPGSVNSPFGKIDYLLGNSPGVSSAGKGGFFGGVMGFDADTLGAALENHLDRKAHV